MGIFSGILCLICFCLLSAKAATAKLPFKKADKMLFKAHKPVSAFLIIACLAHIFFVFPVLKSRNFLVVISGIVIVIFMVLLIYLCHGIKNRKKKMMWHRIMTLFMAISIIGHFTTYIIDFNNYQKNVANIEFDEFDLENVEDGIYSGECNVGYIYVKVEVEIKNGVIVSINLLEHRNERGKNAESIIDEIMSEQRLDVDAISGATNSCNVIKKAIENSITN